MAVIALPLAMGGQVTSYTVYSLLQTFATYGLVALALGLTVLSGEYDISVLGMYGLGGMLAAVLGADNPLLGVGAAVLVGAISGLVQGLVITRIGIDSMAVTLGGYLILLGLTQTVGGSRTVQIDNIPLSMVLSTPVLSVFSVQSLVVFGIFVFAWLLLRYTTVGRDLRAVGADRRTSRVVGVRTDGILVGVFMTSGMLAGLAGAANAFVLAAAVANPGLGPLVFATTAVLIGGIAITGGIGSVWGIVGGALALAAFRAAFASIASPNWVLDLVMGMLLAIAVTISAPGFILRIRSRRILAGARRPKERNAA
ncbi:ABC transporter permease subunit [Microbacterium sp. BR1]|uniref:ABC transporter permease subunit n=1 Tax=Microbacterium sp. BR1 TaxID=1070896 RepID=UPI0012FE3BA6|nr:hypothetical protein [Microbacterium sp. BR1]